MAASPVSVRAGAPARPSCKADRGLRLLRLLCVAAALGAGAALPFELGVAPLPASLLFLRQTPGVVSIANYPYTAIAGQTERLSVQLAGRGTANIAVTYILVYPDRRVVRARAYTDARGYSSHTFRLDGYTPRHRWEPNAWIGVRDASGAIKAGLFFAIQHGLTPARSARPA